MYTKTKLSFCSLLVSGNIIIAEIDEGITLNKALSDAIIYFASLAFKGMPFVYITNRIHSYSVDPIIYKDVSQVKTLQGFAVVSQTQSGKNAEIERLFLNKPFEIFTDIEDAKTWASKIIKENSNNKL
ncbi:hypothetical protein [Olleya sp. HaHaR_3_96]|uniref:hypothetical protein n=1 Tax=Olleya sp. HaHaR_3_96 TaxID=2745560 RepID=UPI001C4F27DB|nr:hypothetical protein [Olleya sp. HaHaR_3_96]QXP58584.1 hypothetical protein H0I26_11715 [Olleya sp. HaHaR_3_96]